ncbi:MAG: DUF6089 family protein [Bacteroidota bacterium]|nr:DUF6089 family protein [Bacteroidota bacterium]
MKKQLIIIFILCTAVANAQPFSIHLMGGLANYNGDLQQKRYTFQQAKGVIAGGLSYHATEHLLGRLDAAIATVGADDKLSGRADMVARNLNFTTPIYEVSLIGEYDLWSLDKRKFTPYGFLGIGLFHFNPYTFDAQGGKVFLQGLSTEGQGFYQSRKNYKRTDINVPVGGGLKYALSDDIRVGFEFGLRVLKTDYLDDVSKTYVDENTLLAARGQMAVDFAFRGDEVKNNPTTYPPAGTARGNPKVNDFYYFTVLKIDFRLPWFDNRSSGGGSYKSLSCPRKF